MPDFVLLVLHGVRYVPGKIFDSAIASKSAAVYNIDLHDQRTSVVAVMYQGTIVAYHCID